MIVLSYRNNCGTHAERQYPNIYFKFLYQIFSGLSVLICQVWANQNVQECADLAMMNLVTQCTGGLFMISIQVIINSSLLKNLLVLKLRITEAQFSRICIHRIVGEWCNNHHVIVQKEMVVGQVFVPSQTITCT